MDIAAWLRGLSLERYEAAFRENEINWAVLPKLPPSSEPDIASNNQRSPSTAQWPADLRVQEFPQ